MKSKKSETKTTFTPEGTKKMTVLFYVFAFLPMLIVTGLLVFQSDEDMPSLEMLDNPPELQASIVFAGDGQTELGRYWQVNRTSISYNDISPFVTDALIATEDERFIDHSGVDFKGLTRAVVYLGKAGGASTITQQLAKQLFTLKRREEERQAKQDGVKLPSADRGKVGRLMFRINEKAQENIIATRLESRYTKEEIITMYLNQFDFLYNAVGIDNAAKVYYNKEAKDLKMEEAAMLVGMCKNPSLYNPHTFKVKNYRVNIALNKKIAPSAVPQSEIDELRSADSLRAADRRNQVLYQWLRNSKKDTKGLRNKITREQYDSLKMIPITTNYQVVDHKKGLAPYFRETLRKDVTAILNEKNEDGSLKHKKKDGSSYNIYQDGLRIYTTIDVNMQAHAEAAVQKHLRTDLQPAFDKNNQGLKHYPFTNTMPEETTEKLMRTARRGSERYKSLVEAGLSNSEIEKQFNEPQAMTVFSWKGEIDTIMSPNDSIRYYKAFLHAGLLSIEPQTGFVKAWVGGADFDHFAYDHVGTGKRQVGSTIKPFVYGTAITMQVVKPCTPVPGGAHCVNTEDGHGNITGRWCPRGDTKASNVAQALALSDNAATAYVMSRMGGYSGPKNISKLLQGMDINLRPEDEVPAMCLGIMDLSLLQMVGAQSMLVNQGIYIRPTAILRIEDRAGNVIYNAEPHSKEVLNQNDAYCVVNMMKGGVQFGTGASLRSSRPWGGIQYPTAGKTGTTQSNADGWFMGLTPELVTGVWVGAEDRAVRFRSMTWGQGARMALPIYGYYMQQVYKDPKIKISTGDFERPLTYSEEIYSCQGVGLNSNPVNPFL